MYGHRKLPGSRLCGSASGFLGQPCSSAVFDRARLSGSDKRVLTACDLAVGVVIDSPPCKGGEAVPKARSGWSGMQKCLNLDHPDRVFDAASLLCKEGNSLLSISSQLPG